MPCPPSSRPPRARARIRPGRAERAPRDRPRHALPGDDRGAPRGEHPRPDPGAGPRRGPGPRPADVGPRPPPERRRRAVRRRCRHGPAPGAGRRRARRAAPRRLHGDPPRPGRRGLPPCPRRGARDAAAPRPPLPPLRGRRRAGPRARRPRALDRRLRADRRRAGGPRRRRRGPAAAAGRHRGGVARGRVVHPRPARVPAVHPARRVRGARRARGARLRRPRRRPDVAAARVDPADGRAPPRPPRDPVVDRGGGSACATRCAARASPADD